MVATKLTTAEELLAMPDDGYRYELIEGVLQRMPGAGEEHSEVWAELLWYMKTFVRERDLGAVVGGDAGFIFGRDPDIVRIPDIAFTRKERLRPRDQRVGFSPIVPDLVVEVVSPSNRPDQLADKIVFYLAAGVRLVLEIDPDPRTVTVHAPGIAPRVLGEGDILDGGDVLPGFTVPVAAIFDLP